MYSSKNIVRLPPQSFNRHLLNLRFKATLKEPSPDPDIKPAKVWLPEGLKCTALESAEQKAVQLPPEVELQGRVKSMLDTGWVFDPYKVSVSAADGVQDPSYGLTKAEHKWFDDMSIRISKAKREKTRCEIGNVEAFSLQSPGPDDNIFLNDFDLAKELDSFYGDTVGISGRQYSNKDFDEEYTDDEVDLLRNSENTLSEIAAPSNRALQTRGAVYKTGVSVPSSKAFQICGVASDTGFKVELGNHGPEVVTHCQDKIADFKDSAVDVKDSFISEHSKESLLQSPSYVDETLTHVLSQVNLEFHAMVNQTNATDQTVHHSNDAEATNLTMASSSSQDDIDSGVLGPNLPKKPLPPQSHGVGTSRTPTASANLSNTQTLGHNLNVSGLPSVQSTGIQTYQTTYVSPYPPLPQPLGRDGNASSFSPTPSTDVHTNQTDFVSSYLQESQLLGHDGNESSFPSTKSGGVHTKQTTLVTPDPDNTQALGRDGNVPDLKLSPADADGTIKRSFDDKAYLPPSRSLSPTIPPRDKCASVGSRSSPIADLQKRALRQHKPTNFKDAKRSVKSVFDSEKLGGMAGEDDEEVGEDTIVVNSLPKGTKKHKGDAGEEEEGASPTKKKARRSNKKMS